MSELRGPGRGEGGEPAAEQQVELHVGDVGGEHAHQLRHLHRARVTCHVSLVTCHVSHQHLTCHPAPPSPRLCCVHEVTMGNVCEQ